MSSDRRRQKKLERQKRKRKDKKRSQLQRRATSEKDLAERSAKYPFGPCFVSAGWDRSDAPTLVSLIVTRARPDGSYVPAVALVDRTCLGIKNGYVMDPLTVDGLDRMLQQFANAHGGDMVRVEAAVAQSIVWHAIDYARSLGFEPHRDFPAAAFAPRPEPLVETPWAHPPRPIYFGGPHDNVQAVLAKLTHAVGEGNFAFGEAPRIGELEEPHDDEDDSDDEDELGNEVGGE